MKVDAVNALKRWIIVLAVTLAFFYALDHALMGVQGLPLNWNMAPANSAPRTVQRFHFKQLM